MLNGIRFSDTYPRLICIVTKLLVEFRFKVKSLDNQSLMCDIYGMRRFALLDRNVFLTVRWKLHTFKKKKVTQMIRNAVVNHPQLGGGIYTIPDVSRILGLPQQRARTWLIEYWNSRFSSGRGYSWGQGKDKAINFLALIEFYVFYQLRFHGVSAQRAVKAHDLISKTLKNPYPFATSKILTDGKSVLFSPDVNTIINADPTLQYNLKEIIERFCTKIEFGDDFLANRFFPQGTQSVIVVDPEHQFGQPVISGTNIPAETIYNYIRGGDKINFIARLYELTEKQVKDAVDFYSKAA
jgi:uncharacterized protein (DUF433 family)